MTNLLYLFVLFIKIKKSVVFNSINDTLPLSLKQYPSNILKYTLKFQQNQNFQKYLLTIPKHLPKQSSLLQKYPLRKLYRAPWPDTSA
jgi:hypothetical protein